MSSRRSLPLQPVDLLIAEALQAEVEGVEPSPRVWERIRRRAGARAARQRFRTWGWNAEVSRVPQVGAIPLPPPTAWEGMALWRYNLVVLRFMDYAGLMFRFGW